MSNNDNGSERLNYGGPSVKGMVLAVRGWLRFFWQKRIWIICFGLLGAAVGLTYSLTQKAAYIATTSFVMESGGRGGGLSSYAGVASAFGIDMGGAGGGLFEGENILELYKSRTIITNTLLTEAVFDGKKQLLVDRFIEINDFKRDWKKKGIENVKFSPDNRYDSEKEQLLHNGIMAGIVGRINGTVLNVSKKDKKLNLIYVTVTSPDQAFSKVFNEKLVENVNSFFLDTKTKKNIENVAILQGKVDSVRRSLASAINSGAAIADATPNQNPTRLAQRVVPIQNSRINAEINQEALRTLLQNLELGKIALLKETPLIQIVDSPILPLAEKAFGKMRGIIVGGIIGVFLIICYLSVRKIVNDALNEP